MTIFGVWANPESVNVLDALLIALIAILVVFAVLIIIIAITSGLEKGTQFALSKVQIMPRKENEILSNDEDAVAAVLTASIDFHKETGKMPRVKSITLWED